MINLRLSQELRNRIQEVAREKSTTASELIRSIMSDYVDFEDKPEFTAEITKRIEALEKEVFKK